MKRRTLIAAFGGTAAVALSPALASAQGRRPVIGYLSGRSLETDAHLLAAFRDGLKESGYIDGQNVTMDFRWAGGRFDRLGALAANLAAQKPDLIAAVGGTPVPLAAKAATANIPIVFTVGFDPVSLGLVSSLNRPGGNMTGAMLLASTLEGKRLDLLRDMLPNARSVALLVNPSSAMLANLVRDAQGAANALGLKLEVLNAETEADLERAFVAMAASKPDGFAVTTDGFFIAQRDRIVAQAAFQRLGAIFPTREFTDAGGLASYASRWADMYRWAGAYAGRILKGERPGDLPIQQPTSYELVVNLKTARKLDFALPPAFLALADEVIE